MKHVRDEQLADSKYGNWGKWCEEELSFSLRNAQRYIRVFEKFKENTTRVSHLSFRVLEVLAGFTDEQIEAQHVIPSTGEVKTVDEMTVRELREVKKALKEAQERAQRAEEAMQQAKSTEFSTIAISFAVSSLRRYSVRVAHPLFAVSYFCEAVK